MRLHCYFLPRAAVLQVPALSLRFSVLTIGTLAKLSKVWQAEQIATKPGLLRFGLQYAAEQGIGVDRLSKRRRRTKRTIGNLE